MGSKTKNQIIFLILFASILSCDSVIYDLNDDEYDRMPDIFAIDNYDSCLRRRDGVYCLVTLELDAEPNSELYQQIQEYSKYKIRHYNHTRLDRGVCVPKTCKKYLNYTMYTEEDLTPILGECLNKTMWDDYELYARIMKVHYCNKSGNKIEANILDWIAAIVVAVILAINVLGSYYHLYLNEPGEENVQKEPHFLTSFSVFQNWKDMCREYHDKNKYVSLRGFNGLRIIALFSVILAHIIYGVQAFGDRVHEFEKLHTNPIYQVHLYGFHLVQISFAMSGFLLAYKFIEYEDVCKSVSWIEIPKILIARFIRLTPSYAIVLLLVISWMRFSDGGPLWSLVVESNIRDCSKYYWHHLFYLNNYVYEDTCLLHTWHVAADVQVFIVGLLVLCLTKRRLLVLACLLVLGLLGPMADVWLRNLYPVAIVTPEFLRAFDNDSFRLSHIRGHNNLPCFVTGMMVGILIFRWQKQGVIIKNQMLSHLSNLLPVALISVFLSNELMHAEGLEPTLASKLAFAAVFRIALCVVIAFWLIAISMKFDSPLCRVLAWSGWVIPSRLAYSVYIIHMNLIVLLMGTRTTKENLTLLHFTTTYLGVTVISFILAAALYVLVEAPCNKMLRRTSMMREYLKKLQTKID